MTFEPEDDLSLINDILAKESISDEQQQFNELSKDHKLQRLDTLVKKSQLYSQIIFDNILQNSLQKKKKREQEAKNESEPRPKRVKTEKKYLGKKGKLEKRKRQQNDIMNMLSTSVDDETKSTKSAIEKSKTNHTQQQPKLVSGGQMKNYQLDGLEWLITLYENGLNGILADEMGLGKTLQCISFIAFLIENSIPGPILIVTPLSTVSNWYNEFKKFAPQIDVVKYTGDKQTRQGIRITRKSRVIITSYELSIKDFNKFNKITDWRYLIVDEGHRLKNFNCLLIKVLKKLNVSNRLLITGTPLQNNLNELWSLLNFILPDIFHDLELFEQWFNFNELTNLSKDKDLVDFNIQEKLIINLHKILKPFILRRLKRDVVKNLPPKKEYLIHIPMSKLQRKIYQDALDNKLVKSLVECDFKQYLIYNFPAFFSTKADYEIMNKFLVNKFEGFGSRNDGLKFPGRNDRPAEGDTKVPEKLSKRLRTPNISYTDANSDDEFEFEDEQEIIEVESESETEDNSETSSREHQQQKLMNMYYNKIFQEVKNLPLRNMIIQLRNICGSPYMYYEPFPINNEEDEAKSIKDNEKFLKILFKDSAKFQVLDQLMNNLLPFNHRILIFSQFTKVLDLLQDWLTWKKIGTERLDGSTSQEEREIIIRDFNAPRSKSKIFLLSTRAGGLGINLTSADTVILFDNDWNPQMDLQAIDRVHRIGQTKPVKIYRFLIKNSVEELLMSKSHNKRFLEKLIIQMGEFKFDKLMDHADKLEENDNLKEILKLDQNFLNNSGNKETCDTKLELDDFTHFNGDLKLLSDEEIMELTRRDDECYTSPRNDFHNITIFEAASK